MKFMLVGILLLYLLITPFKCVQAEENTWWEVQSIDTVKFSRDLAREKNKDTAFEETIDRQAAIIAQTGATHIGLGTPYDEEFYPFMKRWVSAARKYGLNIWFRGNLSGWENWFGYTDINEKEHTERIIKFILDNKEMFADGDIFSSCVECENGTIGDPRVTHEVDRFRHFLIEEYKATKETFRLINKNVIANYFPLNGDVAKLVMDKETTKALGGVVVVDHYVQYSDNLAEDIKHLADISDGKVVLGEIGAPIPDIHGAMTQDEQAAWLKESLLAISRLNVVSGINYWTSFGGSTNLWTDDYEPKKAVGILTDFYKPEMVYGKVVNELGQPLKNARITTSAKTVFSQNGGEFVLPHLAFDRYFTVEMPDYMTGKYVILSTEGYNELILKKEEEGLVFKAVKYIKSLK